MLWVETSDGSICSRSGKYDINKSGVLRIYCLEEIIVWLFSLTTAKFFSILCTGPVLRWWLLKRLDIDSRFGKAAGTGSKCF